MCKRANYKSRKIVAFGQFDNMKNTLPQYFIVDREVLTDKHVIANRLNTFFTNIGPKLASQIETDGHSSYEDFLINPTVHEFSFDEIREQDVVNVIDKLPSKTSSGVDGISTNLLKDITYLISKPLTLIINQCLETGIFPSKLKIAKVIPILKKAMNLFFIIIAQSPSYRRYQRYLSE